MPSFIGSGYKGNGVDNANNDGDYSSLVALPIAKARGLDETRLIYKANCASSRFDSQTVDVMS